MKPHFLLIHFCTSERYVMKQHLYSMETCSTTWKIHVLFIRPIMPKENHIISKNLKHTHGKVYIIITIETNSNLSTKREKIITMFQSLMMENTLSLLQTCRNMWFMNVFILNYLKILPISYPPSLMGSIPIAMFLAEFLHWQVLSIPSKVRTLDGAPCLWPSDVHHFFTSNKSSFSSIIS